MNVRELKEIIAGLPDDTLVVIPGSDHSYDQAHAGVASAEILRSWHRKHIQYMWEYYDDDNRSEQNSDIEDVLVITG